MFLSSYSAFVGQQRRLTKPQHLLDWDSLHRSGQEHGSLAPRNVLVGRLSVEVGTGQVDWLPALAASTRYNLLISPALPWTISEEANCMGSRCRSSHLPSPLVFPLAVEVLELSLCKVLVVWTKLLQLSSHAIVRVDTWIIIDHH